MERRLALQYGRLELTHKVHEYFPKADVNSTVEAGMALKNYCVDQVEHADYESFKETIMKNIPDASPRKIRGLYLKLFPRDSGSTRTDMQPESDYESTTKPATITRTKILGLRFHPDRNYRNGLSRRSD